MYSRQPGHSDVAVGASSQLMGLAPDIDQQLYDRIIELVAYGTGLKKEQIKPETRLFHDARIDGTDGYNLLVAICDEFNIDPKSVIFDRYFGPEYGPNLFAWIAMLLCERDKLDKSGMRVKKVPITVLDLYQAAKAKKFPDLADRPTE
jgi:acyl carrier protein